MRLYKTNFITLHPNSIFWQSDSAFHLHYDRQQELIVAKTSNPFYVKEVLTGIRLRRINIYSPLNRFLTWKMYSFNKKVVGVDSELVQLEYGDRDENAKFIRDYKNAHLDADQFRDELKYTIGIAFDKKNNFVQNNQKQASEIEAAKQYLFK